MNARSGIGATVLLAKNPPIAAVITVSGEWPCIAHFSESGRSETSIGISSWRSAWRDVVGDQGQEGGVAVVLEASLDEDGAAAAAGGVVGQAHAPADPLSVEHPLAAADGVAAELGALAYGVAVADGLGDGRGGHERSFQVAVDP